MLQPPRVAQVQLGKGLKTPLAVLCGAVGGGGGCADPIAHCMLSGICSERHPTRSHGGREGVALD